MATVTKSIGTDSRDYSTITLWEADLDDSGIYSSGDDAVGECYNDSAFDESVTIDGGGTVGLNSVTLTVAEGERHDGTAGTGARIVADSTARVVGTAGGNFEPYVISWIELNGNGLNESGKLYLAGFSGRSRIVHHALVHHAGSSNDGMIHKPAATACVVYNNIVYTMRSGFSGGATGILGCDAYNNTVHDIKDTRGTGAVAEGILDGDKTNNVVTNTASDAGTAADISGTGTESYNASSDATASGTGSLTNITTADQYVSTTVGSEDLHLKAGSDCINTGTDLGTTPTGVNIDIDGFDRNAVGVNWDIGADEYVNTTPTFTIGTTGRDYSTITLWEADLDNTSLYSASDDAVGECYNDSAFDESVTINGGNTVGLDSVTLTVAEGERHDGTAGSGVRLVTSTPLVVDYGTNTAPLAVYLRWLEIDGNSTARGLSYWAYRNQPNGGNYNCILHNGYDKYNSPAGITGYDGQVVNCIIYDILCDNSRDAKGILKYSSPYICNTTIYGIEDTGGSGDCWGIQHRGGSGDTVQNCLVCGVDAHGGANICFEIEAGITVDHNASSDATATGTGSLTNITTADQFVSTTGGSEDLHLKAGSDCINAGTDLGTTPTGVNIDIDGRDRDAEGDTWDIGADEFTLFLVITDDSFDLQYPYSAEQVVGTVSATGGSTPYSWEIISQQQS